MTSGHFYCTEVEWKEGVRPIAVVIQLLWPSGTAEQHEEEEDNVQVDVKSAIDVLFWIQLNWIATNHLLDIKDEELSNQQDEQIPHTESTMQLIKPLQRTVYTH